MHAAPMRTYAVPTKAEIARKTKKAGKDGASAVAALTSANSIEIIAAT